MKIIVTSRVAGWMALTAGIGIVVLVVGAHATPPAKATAYLYSVCLEHRSLEISVPQDPMSDPTIRVLRGTDGKPVSC